MGERAVGTDTILGFYGNQLGLGPGSPFVEAVIKTSQAPYNGLGIWPGSQSVDNPADGSIWIGGYDTNRVAGPFTQFSASEDGCPTCVMVTDMTYDTETGSHSMLSSPTESFNVFLDPWANVLQLPPDVFHNFGVLSNGTQLPLPPDPFFYLYDAKAVLGNITVILQGNYKSTIPASEFFRVIRDLDSNGDAEIVNATYVAARVREYNLTAVDNSTYVWGTPFLTMNYMMADYDKQQFSLAPAVQGPYIPPNGPLAQPLCQHAANNLTNSSSTASPKSASHTGHSHRVGAIAGGVVGGVAGLAIIIMVAILFLRSRRRGKKAQEERDNRQKAIVDSSYTSTEPTEGSENGNANHMVNSWVLRQLHHGPAEVSQVLKTARLANLFSIDGRKRGTTCRNACRSPSLSRRSL